MDVSAPSALTVAKPGKAMQSVGHIAKLAVAEAKAAGVDLPKNAQGMAASAIAQGADPASVFAAMATPEPEAVPEVADAKEAPMESAEEVPNDAVVEAASAGYAQAAEAIGTTEVQDGAEIALAVLQGMGEAA